MFQKGRDLMDDLINHRKPLVRQLCHRFTGLTNVSPQSPSKDVASVEFGRAWRASGND